jgi:hypothetical protein
VPAVDAAAALAELTELSSQIEDAAILTEQGDVLAGTQGDGTALADVGRALLERAAALDGRRPVQVEVATAAGSVFVARENGLTIVATTMPEPSPGLIFYDLKNCLRQVEQPKPKPRRRRPKAKEAGDAS